MSEDQGLVKNNDHQQPQPAPEAPRLTANEPARLTEAWKQEIWQAFLYGADGKSLSRDGVRLLLREIDALRAEVDAARAALAESRASNDRLRAALESPLGACRLCRGIVDPEFGGHHRRCPLASSPAAPKEPARCEDCGSPNHLACDYMPADGQRRWEPAPDEGARGESWAESYLVEHPELRERRCRCKNCQGPPFCGCCNSMLVDLDYPDDDEQPADARPAAADGDRGGLG